MIINNKCNIQNLPVPEKKETLEKFLVWVKPLISDEEYEKTIKLVDQYINSEQSDKIHNFLLERANDKNNSWLVEWWIKYMYLSSRGPLSLECNAPMQYDHPNLKDYDASGIMAIIAHQVATVYLEVKNNNNLINDQQFNAKKEFSLDQLVFLFSSFREPNKIFDSYYTNEETSNFIIIYKNNIPYKIQVIRENQVVNLNKIYVTIKTIINQKDEKDVSFNFITSATNRDIAKDLLDELLLNKKNKESYEELKNAITVLCYDEYKNNSIKERFKNFIKTPNFNHLHGKGMLFTINNDGDVMMCTDHIKVDGGTEIYLMNRISQLFDQKPNLIEIRMMPHFDKIQFDLTNIQKTKLNSEFKRFIDYINKVDVIFIESKTLKELFVKN